MEGGENRLLARDKKQKITDLRRIPKKLVLKLVLSPKAL
jgi:hypothetical protein